MRRLRPVISEIRALIQNSQIIKNFPNVLSLSFKNFLNVLSLLK